MPPLRLTTVRLGLVTVTVEDASHDWDARILLDSKGAYRSLFADALSEPFPTLEQAVAHVEEPDPMPADASCVVHWREDLAPASGEHPCPVCTAPVVGSPRYPRRLCPVCVLEATDAEGRSVRFFNTGFGGGIEGRYADDGSRCDSLQCFVRGIACRAEEHRFGGIVVQRS